LYLPTEKKHKSSYSGAEVLLYDTYFSKMKMKRKFYFLKTSAVITNYNVFQKVMQNCQNCDIEIKYPTDHII